jgi:indolepyruvate decarboxylase
MIFIELIMDPIDTPNVFIQSGLRSANLNFGPRGPQHRPGSGSE